MAVACPDLDPAINLACARGVHFEQMPDNIIAAIYYVAKPLDQARRQQEQREWKRLVPEPLTGKTLGIIGLGPSAPTSPAGPACWACA